MTSYSVSAEAQNDLFEIWSYIAKDSIALANRIEEEFHSLFSSLARMPNQGHTRIDITRRNVLFFPLYSYLVVYQPMAESVRIFAVLRGARNVKSILIKRL